MNSYIDVLRRYRPTIRIETMLRACERNPGLAQKKKAVVKHWWRMVLWYVRLRKASQGVYHPELLRVQHQKMAVDTDLKLSQHKSRVIPKEKKAAKEDSDTEGDLPQS